MEWRLLSQTWCSLNEDTVTFLISYGYCLLTDIMSESTFCFQKIDTETQDTDFTKLLALIMGRQLYTYLPPLSGADEVSVYQWQLVATMHLILCGWHLQGYGCTHSSCVCFSLAGTDTQWCSKCFCGVFSAMLLRFQFTFVLKISGLESYQLLLGCQETCESMNVVAVSWIHDIHLGPFAWRARSYELKRRCYFTIKECWKTTDREKSLIFFCLVLSWEAICWVQREMCC